MPSPSFDYENFKVKASLQVAICDYLLQECSLTKLTNIEAFRLEFLVILPAHISPVTKFSV